MELALTLGAERIGAGGRPAPGQTLGDLGRLVGVAARGRPLPDAEDGWVGLGLTGAAVAVTGLATLPYLFDLNVLDASTAASVLLLGVIGLTGFGSVRTAGGSRSRAMAFAAATVAIAAVVTAIKFTLAH